MKLFKIAIICIAMTAMMAPMAFSGSSSTSSGGDKITITGGSTVTGNPDLNFTPSPTTIMSWATSDISYAVTGVSTKTDAKNGKQYGVVAGESPVYEHAVTVSSGAVDLTDPSSETSLGSGWKDKAGNSAP